jgi:uncharacterized radical SAM superfamily Fe-S cluster-containing enzyme
MLPYDTTSLCDVCYRHIPATVFAKDGKVMLKKHCMMHGNFESVVENSERFYKWLPQTYDPNFAKWNVILIEITDRCNLNCPHCYHLPDNKVTDRPVETIIEQINNFPKDDSMIILAGAEPTVRKDVANVIKEIKKHHSNRKVGLLTNGVKLSNEKFVIELKEAGADAFFIGLNHPDYQGVKVHNKQLKGIKNLVKHGLSIEYIGYTCESKEQLADIIFEAQKLCTVTDMIRIRFGSDIGRTPDEQLRTLSDNYNDIVQLAIEKNYKVTSITGDDNIYHKMIQVGEAAIRLIQWPDVTNIVMDELKTGPWCQFYDGPITNFVHQVITRDAYKNKNLIAYDKCPEEYRYHYCE